MPMTVDIDIDKNLKRFLESRTPGARYASFDYCFNHFQEAHEAGETAHLADEGHLLLSCLQLGFYLASWGMMRGSGDLLQRSVRELVPVIEAIATEPAATWKLDADSYADTADEVLALAQRIRKAFTVVASDILVTKTMLGVFGCIPALDRFFRSGFGCHTLCKAALTRIGQFYQDNQTKIDAQQIFTLDFTTGCDTARTYPKAKIIDMIFFQEGLTIELARSPLANVKGSQAGETDSSPGAIGLLTEHK
jgi:hypothetical protein